MPRKTILTVVLILLIIIFGGLFGFYSYLNQNSQNSSPGSGSSGIFSFFSSGSSPSSGSAVNNNTPGTATGSQLVINPTIGSTSSAAEAIPVLRQISKSPIAGATIFDRIISTTTVATTTNGVKRTQTTTIVKSIIRYVDRATGNVFETATSSLDTLRISNGTFPKMYTAVFDSTGDNLLLQTLPNEEGESITTYFGQLKKPSSTSTDETLTTTPLSNTLTFYAQSPAKDRIFSLLGSLNGTQGVLSNMDGSKKSTLWTSPLREWLVAWPNQNSILLQTKPSADVVGYSYLLNSQTGALTKYIGYINGLTVLASPDTTLALVGQSDPQNSSLLLGLYKTLTHHLQPLFVKTLPEKCVWGEKDTSYIYCAIPSTIPAGSYPDDWYQGKVSFSDSIWKISLITGNSLRVGALSNLGQQDFDAINLTIDTSDDYLIFTNKRDLTLWGLKLPAH
jgi:hypothetical protein